MKYLILLSLLGFFAAKFNMNHSAVDWKCGDNISGILKNADLRDGDNYLCNIDMDISMYAIVGSGLINGWSFRHSNGQIVTTDFIGKRDPVISRMNCIKFKLLRVFDYKDIIFDACHPALNMKKALN